MLERKLRCVLRREWVAATPEEEIRQQLLLRFVQEEGYPAGMIVVEKALRQLPHLAKGTKTPDRRVDVLVYGVKGELVRPLLLVECKAVPLTISAMQQVVGYNHYVEARFVALANGDEERTGWYDDERRTYRFVPRLFNYTELLEYGMK